MAERSHEQIDREKRWKAWVEAVFTEIGKNFADPPTRGARRDFGDWQVEIYASGIGTSFFEVFSNAMKPVPQLHDRREIKWDNATPGDAARLVLDMIGTLSRNEMYVLMKRAMLP